jgi:hypothetical protein
VSAGAVEPEPKPEPEPEPEPEPTIESESAVVEAAVRRSLHDTVHAWIPLAIALVSVLAAVMGWRASLADEGSTHREELSRQDLVHQQQLLVQDHQAVDTDVRAFGQFGPILGPGSLVAPGRGQGQWKPR